MSNVTNMQYLFSQATSFNGDISSWNVSNVTDMKKMFFYASSFNGDLSSWDVSSVTNMEDMFYGTDALSDGNKCAIHASFQSNDVWSYDWSEFCYQFATKEELTTAVDLWISDNSSALATYGTINGWNVSLITNMQELFRNKSSFNDDISNWNVSNVATMKWMFRDASSFNQDISAWDVSLSLIHI